MQIRCPVCEYVRDVSPEKIPPKAEFASCPKCQHRFRFRARADDADDADDTGSMGKEQSRESQEKQGDIWDAVDSLSGKWKEGDDADTATRGNAKRPVNEERERASTWVIPWEQPRVLGIIPSLLRTMLLALLQPSRFFPHVTGTLPLTQALFFYVIFGVLQYVCDVLWSNLVISMAGPDTFAMLPPAVVQAMDFSRLPVILVTAPFLLALQMFITSAVLHLMIRLVDPAQASFPKAFKVVAYSASALVLTVVPLLGPVLGPAWYLALLLLGTRHAFRLDWVKTLLAMSPMYVLMLFAAMSQYAPFLTK